MLYAIRNKKTGRLLSVNFQARIVSEEWGERKYVEKCYELIDNEHQQNFVFVTSDKEFVYDLKKTGKVDHVQINFGWIADKFTLDDLEVIKLKGQGDEKNTD